MFELITVSNVLTGEHTRKQIAYEGKKLTEYIDVTDLDVFINGQMAVTPYSYIPQDDDQVIVAAQMGGGGFKRIFGMALMIGLMIAAPHNIFALHSMFARALVSGAVMMLGGKLINSVFHLDQQLQKDQSSSQTYGWDLPQVQTREGGTIGETFGECIPQPQLLMYHVETETERYDVTTTSQTGFFFKRKTTHSGEKDVQYLNVLYSGGYGPIDSIDDLRIGYTPLSAFDDVQVETRTGTNDQAPISFFPQTVADQSVDMDCKEGTTITRSTDSDSVNAIDVTLSWPGGIYHTSDKGNFEKLTVSFKIAISPTGKNQWAEQSFSLTQSTNSAVRRTYRFEGLEAGRYDVRLTTVTMPITSRDYAQMQWSLISTYINTGAFCRPNKVLVALRIKATNQLNNGIPSLTWRQKRLNVWVYNPAKQAYEQRSAQNPIWAAYDILHHCRQLKNVNTGQYEFVVDGCPAERFTKYWHEWQKAADYADELIPTSDGGTEKRFMLDAFFDVTQKRLEAANKAANVGHATIIRHGTNLGIVVDMPGVVKQVFGEGRTTMSSFSGSFSSRDDRARSVKITYNDGQNDFKNTEFFVRSSKYAEARTLQDNTADLSLFGVARRSQAYREAMHCLAVNERELQTVQFGADVNALVCEYGDIIGVSHAVPRIGVLSGRIVYVSGNTITIDKEVMLAASESYSILVQRSADDALISRDIVAVTKDTTTNTLTLSQGFTAADTPAQYDNYAVGGRDKVVKPFRIIRIEQDGDLKVTITAIEYDPAVYDVNYDRYPIIDYSTPVNAQLKAPINLQLSEVSVRTKDNNKNSVIHATWDMPEGARYDGFKVSYSTDLYTWTDLTTTTLMEADIPNADPTYTYYVRVRAVLDGFVSSAASKSIGLHGNVLPAITPTGITAYTRYRHLPDGTPRYDVVVQWGPSDLTGRVYFKSNYAHGIDLVITEGTTADQMGFSGPWAYAGEGVGQLIIPQAIAGDTYRIAVTTADELGDYSSPDASPQIDIIIAMKTEIPNTPDHVAIAFDKQVTLTWRAVTNTDISSYEIRTDQKPGVESAALLLRTQDVSGVIQVTSRKGTLYVYARGRDGKYSLPAVLEYNKPAPPKPATPTVTERLGGISIVAEPIPAGCNGMTAYIDGYAVTSVHTVNNTLTYSCQEGIYDVTIAYTDIFGEGPKSDSATCVVKAKVSQEMLADEAVSLKAVDAVIKTAIANANDSVPKLLDLTTKTDTNTQNVTSIVANLNATGPNAYKSISSLQQSSDSITSTVAANKSAQDAKNTDIYSQISQNASFVTTLVSNLSTLDKAKANYTAFTQIDSAINLRVQKGDVINQLNLSPTTTLIDGKYVHVTGQTVFDNSVIVNRMLSAGAVTADKMAVGSLSAISANLGTVTAGTISGTTITGNTITGGNISGATITGGTISADVITQAGFNVKSISITRQIVKNGNQVTVPSGYTQAQCIFFITGVESSYGATALDMNSSYVTDFINQNGGTTPPSTDNQIITVKTTKMTDNNGRVTSNIYADMITGFSGLTVKCFWTLVAKDSSEAQMDQYYAAYGNANVICIAVK